ncbi:MAG TPA: type II secretion system protein [Phycisphaerae bacterium]|nr:type II secretion system protein [Phycisphaerae bacterium]
MLVHAPHFPRRSASARGFTLLEMLCTVLIIGIISATVMVNAGTTDATTRLDRAAQAIIAACRYARTQSLGHGQTSGTSLQPTDAYGIQIDTSANTITVYHATWDSAHSRWSLPGTTVTDPLFGSGTCVINLSTFPGCSGVTISAVQLTGTSDTSTNTASPYYCQYRPFGDTLNYGSASAAITLSYGGQSCSVNIPKVGDPTEN